jgi:hypothetical protein
MQIAITAPTSKTKLWTGRAISIIAILFMLFDIFGKFTKPEAVLQGTMALGYPESLITPIGIILLICTVLYIIPRTSILGAVLLTGYLGGALASNFRIEAPVFSNTLFPVYFAILIWAGLYFRSERLRKFITGNVQ